MTTEELAFTIPQPAMVIIGIIVCAWTMVFVASGFAAVFSNDSAKRADARAVMRMIGAPHRMLASLARRDESGR
ncbi:hypothetical protein [Actinoplanes sp. G11-F43]|uniref:hypothetical protein n=1 Tax=Actinoplanes sp. G11-F43 TaxID=3424130 RepID=UPI003D336D55